jgi:hypothetical protein
MVFVEWDEDAGGQSKKGIHWDVEEMVHGNIDEEVEVPEGMAV